MRLVDLLQSVRWPDVETFLLRHDAEAEGALQGYRGVFEHLRNRVATASRMRLHVRESHDDESGELILELLGRDGRSNKDLADFPHLGIAADSAHALAEADFALELQPWDEWLGMEVEASTGDRNAGAELAALCLYEMTMFGFDEEQVTEQREELHRRVHELEQMTEEERREKLIPVEKVMADLYAMLKDRN